MAGAWIVFVVGSVIASTLEVLGGANMVTGVDSEQYERFRYDVAGVFVLAVTAGFAIALIRRLRRPVFHDVESLRLATGKSVLGATSLKGIHKENDNSGRPSFAFAFAGTALIVLFMVAVVMADKIPLFLASVVQTGN